MIDRTHIRSHRLFHDDVPSEAPELPASPQPWELTPAEILSIESEGSPAFRRRMDGPVGALGKISAHNLREYVAQQNAMDAPFNAILRDRFSSAAPHAFGGADVRGERSEPCAAAPLLAGLVTSKTSQTGRVERIEIDRIKSRITRLQKAVKNGAHALDSDAHISGSFRWRRLFVTLTYHDGDDWSPKHIAKFADAVRKWFKRHANVPFRMQWVLELQKRGAVHYHCMIWVPAKLMMPTPDKQGWWKWGQSNIAKTRPGEGGIQRPVSYMSKYCSKVDADQCKRVPKGARMHGCNGLNQEGARWVRWWRAPLFAREALGGAADIRKCLGGYMDALTGEFHESPWKVSISPGGRVVAWRVIPHQSTEVGSYAH